MDNPKQCPSCLVLYPPEHWAYARDLCPSCGAKLLERRPTDPGMLKYEHYDSNVDVRFDLAGLMSPEQRREARGILLFGLGLMLAAGTARFLWLAIEKPLSFWLVPLWYDLIVGVMLMLGVVMVVWALRRFLLHRKALRRR
jgi:phosphoglycerol transferase MdoB-like AlkP superfamily enzyme